MQSADSQLDLDTAAKALWIYRYWPQPQAPGTMNSIREQQKVIRLTRAMSQNPGKDPLFSLKSLLIVVVKQSSDRIGAVW